MLSPTSLHPQATGGYSVFWFFFLHLRGWTSKRMCVCVRKKTMIPHGGAHWHHANMTPQYLRNPGQQTLFIQHFSYTTTPHTRKHNRVNPPNTTSSSANPHPKAFRTKRSGPNKNKNQLKTGTNGKIFTINCTRPLHFCTLFSSHIQRLQVSLKYLILPFTSFLRTPPLPASPLFA